ADYVIKPFSPRELAIRLRRVLDVKDKTSAPRSPPALTHLEQKIDALAVLQNVSTAMNSIREIDELLLYIVEQSLTVANAKHGSVMLLDDQKVLRITAAKGLSQKVIDQTRIRLSEGISGSVAAIGKPLLIANIEEDAKFKRRSREKYETKSLVCAPIKTRDRVIGVLNVNNKQSGDVFNQDDLDILELLANQAGVAIENAELYKNIKENLSEYKILKEAISRVVHSQNWDDMLGGLLTQATSTTNASVGALFLVDEKSDELYVEATAGSPNTALEGLRYKFGEGTIGAAAKKSESVIINHWNGEKDPLRKQVRNLIGYPLSANHKTFGYFVVGNKAQNGDFDKADLSRLNTLSGELLSVLHSNNVAVKSGKTQKKKSPEDAWLSDDSREFCSTVAHELKAPLTSIHGFNEILNDQLTEVIDGDQQNYFDLINRESMRLSNLIQNLLNISKIESTSVKTDRRPTELKEVIDEAVWLMTAKLSNTKVSVQVPDSLPPAIVDRDKVSQIVINLLGNAAVYAPAKSEITVAVSDEPDQFVISVSDLGIGVDPAEHEKIFQKFYRADNEINRKTPGTGLGLCIVKQLVEVEGGQISVESDIDKGAKFVFTLPKNI
ncbi:MAG: GAF domain-containing protein, partial [Actinomycetia bacterium]|nr:GAF domain-containing protein [Actinomycetes bacterium]